MPQEDTTGLFREIAEIAGCICSNGWAERNAGNISIRLSEEETRELKAFYPHSSKYKLHKKFKVLGGKFFLISRTGSRMRNIRVVPAPHFCLFEFDKAGREAVVWFSSEKDHNQGPTSELPTHLLIHQMFSDNGRDERVVLHTHLTESVALTQMNRFCSQEALNKVFNNMHPENIIFVPEGIGFIPYTLPGTENLARLTVENLLNHRIAVWEKHGCIATGRNLAEAFDHIELLAKAIRIFFLCTSAGFMPDGFRDEMIDELKRCCVNPGNWFLNK